MYNFFSVIGIRSEHKQILDDAEALIYDSFYVDRMSKVYIAPSEDDRIKAEYINFAIQISSALDFDQFKTQAQFIENNFQSNGNKLLDFDIILQFKNQELLFVDKTIDKYCHILITLNDMISDQPINGITIHDRLQLHKNKDSFTEYTQVKA